MEDELLTMQQATKELNVSLRTLQKWRQEGKIKLVRIGERLQRIPRSELNRFIQSCNKRAQQ